MGSEERKVLRVAQIIQTRSSFSEWEREPEHVKEIFLEMARAVIEDLKQQLEAE